MDPWLCLCPCKNNTADVAGAAHRRASTEPVFVAWGSFLQIRCSVAVCIPKIDTTKVCD